MRPHSYFCVGTTYNVFTVTGSRSLDCTPVRISHDAVALCGNGSVFCVLVVLCRLLSHSSGAGVMGTSEERGRFWLYSCDWNPRLSQPFVLREWTWPIVKGRHPPFFLFFFFFVPRNSHSDAAEQERARSQRGPVIQQKPLAGSRPNSFQPPRLRGYSC